MLRASVPLREGEEPSAPILPRASAGETLRGLRVDRNESLGAANAAEVVAAGVKDNEMDSLRRAIVEDVDDIAELDALNIELAPRRALDVDGDEKIFTVKCYAVPGIVKKANGLGPCCLEPAGKIMRRIQDAPTVCILNRGHDLKAHFGERRTDEANVIERILERTDVSGIALVPD